MGSRGSFIDVNRGNFNFTDNGQHYETIGVIGEIQILKQPYGSVKAPEYSHSPNRIYAVIQNDKLKHISFYDDNHKQVKVIDLEHYHCGLKPHVHYNLNHTDKSIPLNEDDYKLIDKIKRRM